MYLSDRDYMIHQQWCRSRLQEAERRRLLQSADAPRSDDRRLRRKVACRVGDQLVRWGEKLQSYGTLSAPRQPDLADEF